MIIFVYLACLIECLNERMERTLFSLFLWRCELMVCKHELGHCSDKSEDDAEGGAWGC